MVSTAGYIITVNVVPVVSAALVGLGVGAIATSTGAFDTLVANCVSHLQDLGLCQEYSIEVFGYEVNGISLFGLTPTIIDAIRSWLYETETVTQTVTITTSGFSGTLIGSTETYGPYYSVNYLCQTYPSELTSVIKDLGIMQKVAVFNICNSEPYYLVGLYWAEDGRLMQGIFENPLGQAHASLYGVHFTGDLALVEAGLVQLHKQGYSGYASGIFFDKSYAEAMPDFLTSRYFAVDWSYDFAYKNFGQYSSSYEMGIPVFTKESTNSVWNSSTTYLGKYSAPSKFWKSYYIGASDITWGNSSSTTIAVSDGLSQGEIALQEESLEVGYSDWYSNSKVLTTTDDQQVQVYPFPYSNAISDYYTATQPGIWNGTLTQTGTDTGTGDNTNTGTNTGTSTWEPPTDPGAFALDLSNYFPFCIPFDLYDFFSCLNADPVAPVIQWELPLPGGSTYPIELDLSPFDSVAQLLRRLQLLLFIVGLAIKTRDLIKG